MQLKIQSLFPIDPYWLTQDLGLEIVHTESIAYTYLPQAPEDPLLLANNEFISLNRHSRFIAGDIFDFLAAYYGDYHSALEYLFNHYSHLIEMPVGVSPEANIPFFVEQLNQKRDFFQRLTALRHNLTGEPEYQNEVTLWMNQHDLDPTVIWPFYYLTSYRELADVLDITDDRYDSDEPCLIAPYFQDYHTISAIRIYDPNERSQPEWRELSKHPVHYFGLHGSDPTRTNVFHFNSDLNAAWAHQQQARSGQDPVSCIQAETGGILSDPVPLFLQAVLIQTERDDFDHLFRVRGLFDQCRVGYCDMNANGFPPPYTLPWNHWVITQFRDVVNEEAQSSPRLRRLIQSIKSHRDSRDVLMRWLAQHDQNQVLQYVQKKISMHEHYEVQNLTIRETNGGYAAHRRGGGAPQLFTNFLIRVDDNIWYSESQELYHSGRVIINREEYPILFPRRMLHRVRDLERSLMEAVFRNQGGSQTQPMITDSTYQKTLQGIINYQASRVRRQIGLYRLGWNEHQRSFQAPFWNVSPAGLNYAKRFLHPSANFLTRSHTFVSYQIRDAGPISPFDQSLIALLVCLLVRSFTQSKVPGLELGTSKEMQAHLAAVFRPFGQQSPVRLPSGSRGLRFLDKNNHLSNYPVYAVPTDQTTPKQIQYPVLFLTDNGWDPAYPLDQERFADICQASHRYITDLLVQLIRHGGIPVSHHQDPGLFEVILEGRNQLQRLTGHRLEVLESSPTLYRHLYSVTIDQLQQYCWFDLRRQTTWLWAGTRESHSILGEVQRLDPSAELVDNQWISLEPEIAKRLLEGFYGCTIALYDRGTQVTDPSSSGDDGQSASG